MESLSKAIMESLVKDKKSEKHITSERRIL